MASSRFFGLIRTLPRHRRAFAAPSGVAVERKTQGAEQADLSRRSVWIAILAICLVALVFRSGRLTAPPQFDELYHLIAARNWLETGRPEILDGEYTRVRWFTYAIASLFKATGEQSLFIGRLPSVLAGTLLPVVLFLWLRARAGWTAGLVAALLVVFWPQGIDDSQILRFYAWHGLTFLSGAVASYQAATAAIARDRLLWGALALASLAVAFYLQITTAFGIIAILAWLAGALLLPAILVRRHGWAILALIAAAGIAVLALAQVTGLLGALWDEYRWTAGWAAGRQDDASYYFWAVRERYPGLWPLLPLAAIVALSRNPRLASFCLVLFGTIFLGMSFGGMKTERYLSFGMPFFFAVVAIAAGAIGPVLGPAVVGATRDADPTPGRRLAVPVLGLAVLFAGVISTAGKGSIDALRGRPLIVREIQEDWSGVGTLLGPWRDVPFRVTTHELHTAAFVGDYDLLLSANRMTELPDDAEFTEDPRTGRPVIGEIETLARVLDCEPEGLFLTGESSWTEDGEGARLRPVFEAGGRRVEIRSGGGVLMLHWSGGRAADPGACDALPL